MRAVGVLLVFWAVQLAVSSVDAFASDAKTELRRLAKCYGLLVSERIRTTDPLFIQVKNGVLSGTDACMELLSRATLGADGRFPLVNGSPDPLAGKIAGNLMGAHRRHFAIEDPMNQLMFASDLADVNQTSYHFIYPFLKPDEPFSKVVTRAASLRAIRSLGGNATKTLWNGADLFFSQGNYHGPNDPKNNYSRWYPTLVERGTLQGLVEDTTQNIPQALVVGYEKYFGKVNLNSNFGAGFLGSQTYHIATHDSGGGGDGVSRVFRNFGKNAYQDAFCRDLPVVRSSDVTKEVRIDSAIPWRVSKSCMSCHASMDEFGGTVRRMALLRLFYSTDGTAAPGVKVGFWTDQTVPLETTALESAPYPDLAPDPDFYRRPPEGRLFFRNHKGDLVNEKVTGLQQMGEAMARQDDLYICEASRVFDFLTGITPVLGDPGNPERPLNLTVGQKWIRELVIQYGLDLKKHQNVRETFRRMVASPLFLDPNAGVNQ